MKGQNPHWFIFDIGNVLLRLDYGKVLRNLCRNSSMSPSELRSLIEGAGGYRDLERGLLDFNAFHQFLVTRGGYRADLSTFRQVWIDFFDGPVAGMSELLRRVRRTYQVAFLSNSNEVHAECIPRDFPQLFQEGDKFIFSHEQRSAKPDPLIFMKALDILVARAEDCLYVDDLPENVEAALCLGFRAFRFVDSEDLRRRLRIEGLLEDAVF